MAKNMGPYFEFVYNKEGARIEYIFLPGNVSKQIFENTKTVIYTTYTKMFGENSDYIRHIESEDGKKTIAIYQTKVLGVVKAILEIPAFRDFKVKFSGVNKNGEIESMLINNTVEAQQATRLIPYFNKNNNTLTTRRSK